MVLALSISAFLGKITLIVAGILALLVLCYNSLAKRNPIAGPIVMGLCRGTNIILGASVITTSSSLIWYVAAVEVCYIGAVTVVARHEAQRAPSRVVRWLPFIFLLVGFVSIIIQTGLEWTQLAGVSIALGCVFWITLSLKENLPPNKVQAKIGSLVRCLILVQAAFLFFSTQNLIFVSMILYLLWPLSWWSGKKIAGS